MKPLLEVRNLRKLYPIRDSGMKALVDRFRSRLRGNGDGIPKLHAVDDVSFTIAPGESLGLVGESGCGKSTLARLIARLADPTDGYILFDGAYINEIPAQRFGKAPERAQIQVVFQDPHESLNPRFTAFQCIADPVRRLAAAPGRGTLNSRVGELAEMVGLAPELLPRFPHQLSGGQKARINIARAIAVSPRLLILDEPTSALDVSVQAVILQLLADLREKLGMSYLFVSHDLNVVRLICDRVLVMYLGKLVEAGPADAVFTRPGNPYTKALISAIPSHDPNHRRQRIHLSGEPRSPVDPDPAMCRFYGRCPSSGTRCEREQPMLAEVAPGHSAACHFSERETP